VCGAALKVTRVPIAWQYEAVTVTAVKAGDVDPARLQRLPRRRGD